MAFQKGKQKYCKANMQASPSPCTHHPSLIAQDQGAGRSGPVSPRTVLMTLLTTSRLSLLSPPHKSEGCCPATFWGPLPCRILPVDFKVVEGSLSTPVRAALGHGTSCPCPL